MPSIPDAPVKSRRQALCGPHRGGTALIVVLIVVVMLSLGAYTFSEFMVTEARASSLFGQDAQARMLAESGVELSAAVLGSADNVLLDSVYHSPGTFGGIQLANGKSQLVGRYSVVAPVENDTSGQLRFGMVDESAKWNLNALLTMGLTDDEIVMVLMSVPGMTDTVCDSILDWLDADPDMREFGAESTFYEGLQPPYAAKNGKFDSLDELLLVQGVTPYLLYGEDANRNGILDPNENDGETSLPYDNSDGLLDLGWTSYFTIYSNESNVQPDGATKINVNQSLLTDLYDQLEEQFDTETATFIAAFRAFGPVNPVSDGGNSSTGNQTTDDALKKLAESIAKNLASGTAGQVTRNGMDLSQGAKVKFVSLYELIDAQVAADIGGQATLLDSPWSSGGGNLATTWPALVGALSLSDSTVLSGRININQARRETLLGVPGMTEELADSILARKLIGSDGSASADRMTAQSTTVWLLTEGLVDLPTLVQMDKYTTGRGQVQRVQAVGFFDGGGPVARVEAVIDATQIPPRIVFHRDLSSLGPGYRSSQLSGATGP